jgi:hypothetical protein
VLRRSVLKAKNPCPKHPKAKHIQRRKTREVTPKHLENIFRSGKEEDP